MLICTDNCNLEIITKLNQELLPWFEFPLEGNLWLFLVLKLQTLKLSENFLVKSSIITYLTLKYQRLFSISIRNCSVSKQGKVKDLPLSWKSSQVITWAHKCHFSSLEGFMHNNVMNGCWCDLRRDTREYHQDPPLTRKWERTGAS